MQLAKKANTTVAKPVLQAMLITKAAPKAVVVAVSDIDSRALLPCPFLLNGKFDD
jgi:hypothetical protein